MIPDQARCPASAQAHLLLLPNRSLAKCPLACQSVNSLVGFFVSATGKASIIALPFAMHELHNQLGEEGWWGSADAGGAVFSHRRLITHPICSQCAWRALRLVTATALPHRPVIFYSGAGTASLLIYLQEGKQQQTSTHTAPTHTSSPLLLLSLPLEV